MNKEIRGVLPIVHTPFDDRDEIDWPSFHRQIDWAVEQGAHGCCTGMVSELLRLTPHERTELTERLAQAMHGRGVVIASVGAECLKQALLLARHAEQSGCDAIMAIPPISTALPDCELSAYYRALADEVALPLIVQDASAYVGQSIPLRIHVDLLNRYGAEKVMFKPEAAPIGPNLSALREATEGRARVFEGSGGICLVDSFRRGLRGTMPGMEFLDGVVALWGALVDGDEQKIYRLYLPLCALVALQMQAGLDGFLAVEKYVLAKRGIFASSCRRRPNSWDMDRETQDEVDRLLGLLDAAISNT